MPVPSPFHERTAALCSSFRWKEWAGYHAVCSYDTCHEPEYFALRNAAGMLDVSPLKKYEVTGPDAAEYLAFVATRDIRKLRAGRVTYTAFCDPHGKVVDDGTVARLEDERFRVTAASPTMWWLERHSRGFDVAVADTSESTAALAIQGPTSRAVLESATGSMPELRFFGIAPARIAGVGVEISRTGYTGDLGYEVWMPADEAIAVWDALADAGRPHGMLPVGLDALDVTRVEAGFVLQDVDYFSAPRCIIESRKSSPYELGLGWTVQLEREPFVGQDALRAESEAGSAWAFVGLDVGWEALEAAYDRHGLPPHVPMHAWRTAVPVYNGQRQIGQATSGAWSPILKKNLALASVRVEFARIGQQLEIEHTVEFQRGTLPATVVERPFFDPERKRA